MVGEISNHLSFTSNITRGGIEPSQWNVIDEHEPMENLTPSGHRKLLVLEMNMILETQLYKCFLL